MKKSSVRMFMLSCVMIAALPAQAQTTTSQQSSTTTASDFGASMNAVNAANASAGYTGNPAMAQQAAMPGQVMTPPGMQTGQPVTMVPGGPLVPGLLPGQQQPEVPVTMRYDRKKVEGFYGAELPARLFNNVPSEWTKP